MTNVLSRLFDYQKFEKEPELQSVIDETRLSAKVVHLMDDELSMVAGGSELDETDLQNAGSSSTVPFTCMKCGLVFDIELGVKQAVCPKCKHTHTING